MKNPFVALVAILLAQPCFAIKHVNNGGDLRAIQFVQIGELITGNLLSYPRPDLVSTTDFRHAVEDTVIESTDDQLSLNGAAKDAINTHTAGSKSGCFSNAHIVFNRQAWDRMTNPNQRVTLVAHEYLGILGIDDSTYWISTRLAALVLVIPSGDNSGIMAAILYEHGFNTFFVTARAITQIGAESVTCKRQQNDAPVGLTYSCDLQGLDKNSAPLTVHLVGRQAYELWTLIPTTAICPTASCRISLVHLNCFTYSKNGIMGQCLAEPGQIGE